MTDMEKMIKFFMNDIYVSIPCKIESLSGMYANVKPLVYNSLELPVISSVPILYIGNSTNKLKFKNTVGDIVTVFFTQLDLGKFLTYGTSGQVNSTEKFNLTNAFALPFCVHTKVQNESMATADFEIIGDIEVTGNITVTGGITTTGDCVADGVSLINHTHLYSPGSGTPTDTDAPS